MLPDSSETLCVIIRGLLVYVVYKCMIESELLQVQTVVDHNIFPDTNFSMGQHCVVVTVAESIDVGKLIMLN